MTERNIKFDDVEIATQAFGDPAHEPILLIMGAMASMLWWPDGFCQKLAALKYYVIRYDNRDTGRSTIYEPGEPPYTMDDMAADAVRVLDGYGIDRVNLIGMSLGGTIAQIAALSYPERVKTLTLMSTTPIGIDTSGLPHTTDAYMAHAATGDAIDWTDNAQVIEFLVRDTRMIAGVAHTYDEGRARAFVERDVRRAKNFVSATNHFMLRGGQALKGKLAELAASLLVIHGTADPIYPVEHGELLARTVRGAKLVRLEGGGHEIHPNDWEEIIFAIDAHLR
ncbi:alpha/beta hydrolase [Rhizobium redzepovicii]|uniref:Alpha/beta hydrolase n=1 Tax=Rhizobium redzepovicii TaxID=2867518 RepID=A0AAW8P1S0_9HYPH|nr:MULTISPECIES: alpha/beta fold hydrolase [Rhizobium]MBB3523439.1 pimeloyl-ACP methyl ester carboxylesterase [Rhizobium sp. BK456]MDR9759959.1 alpha/beta hydrolase [Rhizobium redzepovicii]MDR9780523.1 alpha/beta hydrolase [Rhizobium redzepovicii]